MQTFWFIVIALFFTGFFVLEGFDFGVGMLHSVVGRTDDERRVAINTIGPLWDGNEVWLIVAGAGMFAAFPGWYATMFSGLYLALVLLLVALIVRGVSFEYRGRRDGVRWRGTWDWLLTVGSLLAPAADRGGAGRPAGRAPDRLVAGVHRLVLGPADTVRGVRRAHPGRHLRAARLDVPGPEDHRRDPGAGGRAGPADRPGDRCGGPGVRGLDPDRDQPGRGPRPDPGRGGARRARRASG